MTMCIFGGSFDPPTKAHINFIKQLSKKFDKVLVVVNLCNYYRKDFFMLTYEARKKILESVCEHYNLNNVEITDLEKDLPAKHTYIDTLIDIKSKYSDIDEIYTAIGGDSYKNFKSWTRWQDILSMTKLIVIPRNTDKYEPDPEVPHELLKVDLYNDGSGTEYRKKIYEKIILDLI